MDKRIRHPGPKEVLTFDQLWWRLLDWSTGYITYSALVAHATVVGVRFRHDTRIYQVSVGPSSKSFVWMDTEAESLDDAKVAAYMMYLVRYAE